MVNLKKRILGYVLTLVMIFSMTIGALPVMAEVSGTVLSANDLTEGTLTGNLESGIFQITATGAKTVKIDSNSKVAEDGTSFSQRIKLGGSGKADYRSIHFTASGASDVTVYAMSSSSSSDRQLDLYSLDGTLVDSMEAPGAGLNMKTFSVEAGDYYLASPSSGVNVYGVTLAVANATMTLGISSLEQEELVASKEINGFTIAATDAKKVKIDSNSKTAEDGSEFTQRLKLGGSGSAEYRSIHFTASASGDLTVYAMSSSSSSDRQLDLYNLDGTLVDSMEAPGAGLNMKTFKIEAGDYYLASPSSGVNVYEVILTMGKAAAVERLDWSEVAAPEIGEVTADGADINVTFTLVTGTDGADKAEVTMTDSKGAVIETKLVGKSTDDLKSATFVPGASGTYTFKVTGLRNDVSEGKDSAESSIDYVLPLGAPTLNVFNTKEGVLNAKWNEVKEAEKYVIEAKAEGASTFTAVATSTGTETMVSGLAVGTTYELLVKAVRGTDETASEIITKKVKAEDEREWAFTWFGQSTNGSRNTFEMIDEDAFTFKLSSATYKEDGTIKDKGGKFTTFHDGVSFYYTAVDPKTENFELTATFTVDFINPTADGQEGFGLLAMDSLGAFGVNSVNHYTNSAGVIATKFEDTIDGTKYTSKDTLGTRFVTGITPEVLASGDSAIAQNGKNESKGFSYDTEDLVKKGDVYTLTLKKTNTGYHGSIEGSEERVLYGVDELLQLDAENLYVGFAVARGCNATVSDVTFTTSDPATDPAAKEKPVELISYSKKIDSPTTSSTAAYEFVYVSDVPGVLTVADTAGTKLVDQADIAADVDFTADFTLAEGSNAYKVIFTPDADYIPGENQKLDSYDSVTMDHTVVYKTYNGDVLYVSPAGTSAGDGSKADPLDIQTAVDYVKAGQTVEMAGGTYMLTRTLIIERGNSGTSSQVKTLKSAKGERAVLNFSKADSGMVLWGDNWRLEGFDVTETPGNKKGLQIAGDDNIISLVNAYKCGDTGIQISGTSQESFDKWPANNLIVNCTSYDNMDPGQNNADGFAAKITVGDGNVFDGCIAYNNLDDGWDLFAKIETGPIGAVTIRNSLAYNNGTLTDGTGKGDGNGFKLGGDGIAVAHRLENSIAYNNNETGITSNSNPAVIIENCTAYGNGRNLALYGKGSDSRAFVLEGLISMAGKEADNISEMPELASDTNYLTSGDNGVNKEGASIDKTVFASVDTSAAPTRKANGSVEMNGLFELTSAAPSGVGAVIGDSAAGDYVVVAGDTLSGIALDKLGKASMWKEIYELNKSTIADPDLIQIGQVLLMPY